MKNSKKIVFLYVKLTNVQSFATVILQRRSLDIFYCYNIIIVIMIEIFGIVSIISSISSCI